MESRIHIVNGMPVETPILDPEIERERERINAICVKEYEDKGTLSSEDLIKANEHFLHEAKRSLLKGKDTDNGYRE